MINGQDDLRLKVVWKQEEDAGLYVKGGLIRLQSSTLQ